MAPKSERSRIRFKDIETMPSFDTVRRGGAPMSLAEPPANEERGMGTQPIPVGEELRHAREEAGLDLVDVAAHLRIRSNFLAALEEGRPDSLPGITYAIGYVRTYAGFLGLDPDVAVRRFKEEAAGLNSKTQLVFPSPAPEGRVPGLVLMLVAAVLAGGAYGGWYWMSQQDASLRDLVPMVPERLARLIEGDAPSLPVAPGAPVTVTGTGTAVPAPAPKVADTAESAVVPTAVAPTAVAPTAAPSKPVQSAATPAPSNPAPSAPVASATAPAPSAATGSVPAKTAVASAPGTTSPAPSPTATTAPATAAPVTAAATAAAPSAPASAAPTTVATAPAKTTPPAPAPATTTASSSATPSSAAPASTPSVKPATAAPTAAVTSPSTLASTVTPSPVTQAPAAGAPSVAPVPPVVASALLADPTKPQTPDAASDETPDVTAPPEPVAAVPSTLLPTPDRPQAAAVARVDAGQDVPAAPRIGGLIGSSEAAVPAGQTTAGPIDRVMIRATGDSWVQVRDAQGTALFTRVLRAGDVYRVPDQPGLKLATGNAGALEVLVDGNPAPSLGGFGEVVRNIVLDPTRLAAGTATSGNR